VRRNIYLVVREALHNMVKHSGATHVTISLTPQPSKPHPPAPSPAKPHPPAPSPPGEGVKGEWLTLSIRDNGKGFDPDKLEFPGNGLVNMKKRMNDVGGEFRINSKPGEGTIIELGVTLK
jgi:signal transduction histidine kinase